MKLFLLSILHILTLSNKPDSLENTPSQERFQQYVNGLATTPFMANGMVGVCIKSVTNNKVLVEYNSQKSLAPASTLKLITSATALSTLGEDYTYTTKLDYSGQITDSILVGNIIINGIVKTTVWKYSYRQIIRVIGVAV